MSDEIPTPEPTGQAPAIPGASAPETPPLAQDDVVLTAKPAEPAAPEPAKPAEVADVIPDKYEFKALEGQELDIELLDALAPTLKELGLTQAKASQLVDSFNTIAPKLFAAREAAAEKQFQEYVAQVAKENEAAIKKEWGNNFDGNFAIAQRGIARTLSDAGKKKLEDSGLGRDPEFMKAFYQVGKMIQEDIPPPNTVPANTTTRAERMYPNSH